MQLLEQLAMGEHINPTLESITIECASVFGYMECMSELCESEILLEGIDIKGIFKRIGDAIISFLGKIKDLGMRAIGFLKTKAKWFASKFKRKEGGNKSPESDGTTSSENPEPKKEEAPKPAPKKEEQNSSSESPKQDDQTNEKKEEAPKPEPKEKTRDEKIADILSQNPYSGPHPNGIIGGLQNVYSFCSETVGTKIPNNMSYDLRYFKKVLNGEKELTADDKEEFDQEFSNLSRRFRLMFEVSDYGWSSLKGVLNGPNDIPKAITHLYLTIFDNKHYYYDKNIFKNIKEINFIRDQLSVAGNKIANMTDDMISIISKNTEYCSKKSQEISKDMEILVKSTKIDGETSATIQKYMSQIMKDFTMLANVNISLLSAVPKILATATDDVGKIQAYLNSITAKINSI